jgi:hypothetical protein
MQFCLASTNATRRPASGHANVSAFPSADWSMAWTSYQYWVAGRRGWSRGSGTGARLSVARGSDLREQLRHVRSRRATLWKETTDDWLRRERGRTTDHDRHGTGPAGAARSTWTARLEGGSDCRLSRQAGAPQERRSDTPIPQRIARVQCTHRRRWPGTQPPGVTGEGFGRQRTRDFRR